jgi:hypothetical protein
MQQTTDKLLPTTRQNSASLWGFGISASCSGKRIHRAEELLARRVYGVALGYEDLNDHSGDEVHLPSTLLLAGASTPRGYCRFHIVMAPLLPPLRAMISRNPSSSRRYFMRGRCRPRQLLLDNFAQGVVLDGATQEVTVDEKGRRPG